MTNNNVDGDQKLKRRIKTLSSWSGVLKVVFRLIIIMGLLLFLLFLVLVLLIPIFPVWFLAFPLSVIGLGVLFARIEYTLHKRLTNLRTRVEKQDDAANEEGYDS